MGEGVEQSLRPRVPQRIPSQRRIVVPQGEETWAMTRFSGRKQVDLRPAKSGPDSLYHLGVESPLSWTWSPSGQHVRRHV